MLLIGSVALAFLQAPAGTVFSAQAELPSSLFVTEEEDEVAPVAEVITSDIAPPASPIPSPMPPAPIPKERLPSKGVDDPHDVKVRFELTFSSEIVGNGKGKKIRYSSSIINRSEATDLKAVVFKSHIPEGTQWLSSECEPGFRRLTYRIDGSGSTEVCLSPKSDPAGHEVWFEIPEPIPPGGSAVLSFDVGVVDPAREVFVTHAHATAAGVTADSTDVTTEVG